MDNAEKLLEKRTHLLKQIAALGPMRRGSLTAQFVETVDAHGAKTRRGPYTVYSFKDKGKTVSRRITHEADVAVYRDQIEAFRQYQRLTGELVVVSQRLADVAASQRGAEKKTPRR
jgi:hypothetical protein